MDTDTRSHAPPSQQPLPFDDGADEPIAYALTAAARRVVAPESVPPLRVVPATEERGDTRPSRARALRRAGLEPRAIAAALDVDELLVRAWVDDVAGRRPERGTVRRLLPPDELGAGHRDRAADEHTVGATADHGNERDEPADGDGEEAVARGLARASAHREGQRRLAEDPAFAAGLGLLAGAATVEPTATTVVTADLRLVVRLLGWLKDRTGLEADGVRVVLRLGRNVAGDLARHRWAEALELPIDRIAATRSRGVAEPSTVEALVRVTDPTVAVQVAGWCDAFFDPAPAEVDAAF
jgi:hypothetical protein